MEVRADRVLLSREPRTPLFTAESAFRDWLRKVDVHTSDLTPEAQQKAQLLGLPTATAQALWREKAPKEAVYPVSPRKERFRAYVRAAKGPLTTWVKNGEVNYKLSKAEALQILSEERPQEYARWKTGEARRQLSPSEKFRLYLRKSKSPVNNWIGNGRNYKLPQKEIEALIAEERPQEYRRWKEAMTMTALPSLHGPITSALSEPAPAVSSHDGSTNNGTWPVVTRPLRHSPPPAPSAPASEDRVQALISAARAYPKAIDRLQECDRVFKDLHLQMQAAVDAQVAAQAEVTRLRDLLEAE